MVQLETIVLILTFNLDMEKEKQPERKNLQLSARFFWCCFSWKNMFFPLFGNVYPSCLGKNQKIKKYILVKKKPHLFPENRIFIWRIFVILIENTKVFQSNIALTRKNMFFENTYFFKAISLEEKNNKSSRKLFHHLKIHKIIVLCS